METGRNSLNIKIRSKCRLSSWFFNRKLSNSIELVQFRVFFGFLSSRIFSSVSKGNSFSTFYAIIRAKTFQSVNSRQHYKSRLSRVSINCITRNCSMVVVVVVVHGFASKSFGGPSGPRWIAIQGGGSWVRSGFAFMAFDHAIPRYEGHRR